MSGQKVLGLSAINMVSGLLVAAILSVVSVIIAGWLSNRSLGLWLTLLNTALIMSLVLRSDYTPVSPKRLRVIRDPATSEIHLVEGKTCRHIPDPRTFNYLGAYFGFGWSDIEYGSSAEMKQMTRESTLPSIRDYCPSENDGGAAQDRGVAPQGPG